MARMSAMSAETEGRGGVRSVAVEVTDVVDMTGADNGSGAVNGTGVGSLRTAADALSIEDFGSPRTGVDPCLARDLCSPRPREDALSVG